MKKLLTTFLAMIIFTTLAFAQGSKNEQELIKLDKDWSAAIERGDRDALNRIMADDFTSGGETENKTVYIERTLKNAKETAADAELKNYVVAPSAYSVKFKSNDTAVMTHVSKETGVYKGQFFTDYRNSLHVWMKRSGRWQVVASEGAPFTNEQALLQLENDWGAAAKSKDKAWFERTFADEYTSIGSSGKMRNKTEDIAETMSNSDTLTTDEASDMRVRVYGDAAVVTGRLHQVGKGKDGSFDRNYYWTDTLVKRDGRWQVVASQSTLVKPETTAKK